MSFFKTFPSTHSNNSNAIRQNLLQIINILPEVCEGAEFEACSYVIKCKEINELEQCFLLC